MKKIDDYFNSKPKVSGNLYDARALFREKKRKDKYEKEALERMNNIHKPVNNKDTQSDK